MEDSSKFPEDAGASRLRKARKLILLGSTLVFLVAIVKIAAIYYLSTTALAGFSQSQTGFSSHPPFFTPFYIGQNEFDFYSSLSIFGIAMLLIFALLLISSFKIGSGSEEKALRWSRTAFLLSIIFTVVEISLPQMMIDNLPFAYSILSPLSLLNVLFAISTSTYGGPIAQLPSIVSVASLVALLASLIGCFVAALGASYGLGDQSKHYILRASAVMAILLIMLSGASLFFANSSNSAALNLLNEKINVSGSNFHYLLSNSLLYYSTVGNASNPGDLNLHNALLSYSGPQKNISDFLYVFGSAATSSNVSELNKLDMGQYNPFVRAVEIGALFSLGTQVSYYALAPGGLPHDFLNGSETNANIIYLIAPHASTLQSLYELLFSGTQILLIADDTARLFSCAVPSSSNPTPVLTNYSVSMPIVDPKNLGSGVYTSDLELTKASTFGSLGQLSLAWLELMLDVNPNGLSRSLDRGYFQCSERRNSSSSQLVNTTRLSSEEFFYALSLPQYGTYALTQILYNKSYEPSIEFIGYDGKHLIVNLGNLDLNGQKVPPLYLDQKQLNYTRYFNFLLVDGINLSVGFHNLSIFSQPTNLGQSDIFYVSPYISIQAPPLSSGEKETNLFIMNPSKTPLEIHDPKILSASNLFHLGPKFSAIGYYYGSAASNFLLTSARNITYIRNGTGFINGTISTPILIGASGNLTLGANQTIALNYTVTNSTCYSGTVAAFYLLMNTSRGTDFQVLLERCY